MTSAIEIGYQVFASDGGEKFGAVRDISDRGVTIYVENAGDFTIPFDAIEAVHSQKVIVKLNKLDKKLRDAIGHAHDAETPGL